MTNSLIKQLQNLLPGQSMVYYTSDSAPISKAGCPDMIEARNLVYNMYLNDLGYPVQRIKSGDLVRVFEYVFIRKIDPPCPEAVFARKEYHRGLEDKKFTGMIHGGYVTRVRGAK